MVVATVLGTLVVGRAAAPHLDPGAERFVHLPLFNGLAPASLEQAAQHLSRIRVTPGEVVVHGRPADRFFHILDGSFEVTQTKDPGGAHASCGPWTGRGVRRDRPPAGRRADGDGDCRSDGALLVLDGQRFLELVNAG